MTVQAWTNSYNPPNSGFLIEPLTRRTVIRDSTGKIIVDSTTVENVRTAFAGRAGHTSNNVVMLYGIVPWRNPSSYTRRVWKYNWKPANYSYKSGTSTVTVSGITSRVSSFNLIASFPIENFSWTRLAEPQARANTECLNRLSESKVSYGTFVAEARKSAESLATRFAQLGKALHDLKRGRVPKVPNYLFGKSVKGLTRVQRGSRDVANLYLEWKYGWKPLCMDLYQMFLESKETLRTGGMIFSATRNITSNFTDSEDRYGFTDRIQNSSVRNGCKLYASISDEWLARAQSLDVLNPLSLAWELVPYSFVIDWGIPIGNYLSALSATVGLNFVGGFESQSISAKISAREKLDPSYEGEGMGVEVDYFGFTRTKLGGFPEPLLYGKSPLSSGNISSAIALWRNLK